MSVCQCPALTARSRGSSSPLLHGRQAIHSHMLDKDSAMINIILHYQNTHLVYKITNYHRKSYSILRQGGILVDFTLFYNNNLTHLKGSIMLASDVFRLTATYKLKHE